MSHEAKLTATIVGIWLLGAFVIYFGYLIFEKCNGRSIEFDNVSAVLLGALLWPVIAIIATPFLVFAVAAEFPRWIVSKLPIGPEPKRAAGPDDDPLCPRCKFPRHPNCECGPLDY